MEKNTKSAPAGRRAARGFTLLELVVVIAIISTLAVVAISRLLVLRVIAERTAMESVVGTLQSAVGIQMAADLARQDMRAIGALVGSNPMDTLAQLPRNYLGAFEHPDPARLAPGNWYYDRSAGVLVYLVRYTEFFRGGLGDPPRIQFAIQGVYGRDPDAAARRDLEGLRLVPLEAYRWTD